VQLASDPPLPELPPGVTVPAGQTQSSFTVPIPGPSGTTYRVTGSFPTGAGLASATAPLTATQAHVESRTLSEKVVSSDDEVTGTVALSCPAAPGGTVVTLELTGEKNTERLDMPRSVTVAAGRTEATFAIRSKAGVIWTEIRESTFTIQASAGGQSQKQELTVYPTIHSFYPRTHGFVGRTESGVRAGEAVTGAVVLSLPAPKGGRAVQIGSFDPASVPVNPAAPEQLLVVVVPEGQDSIDITIQTRPGTEADVVFEASTPTSRDDAEMLVLPRPQP
jgi:hypothetical protein